MSHFASLELDNDLDSVAVTEETVGMVDFCFKVMVTDAAGELKLLEFGNLLFFAVFFFFLFFFAAELALIHYPADRRSGFCGDFNKVIALLVCHTQCGRGFHYSELVSFRTDQSDL